MECEVGWVTSRGEAPGRTHLGKLQQGREVRQQEEEGEKEKEKQSENRGHRNVQNMEEGRTQGGLCQGHRGGQAFR